MTPSEEQALLASVAAAIDVAARQAQERVIELIRDGVPPREAVQQAVTEFGGDMADSVAAALSLILAESVGAASVLEIKVGAVTLSRRLYAEAEAVGAHVQSLVQNHVRGLQDARKLALQLFEGYGFREPDAEPLQINPREPRLPKYLRDLASDPKTASELDRAFARIQVDGLATGPLRAAYTELLDAIDAVANGAGREALDKRIAVAFYERVRYFASRIALTELHRAYMNREADLLLQDQDVEFVQIRRAPGRRLPCICDLFAGRDRYGLGAGVYPKAKAPKPGFHPFCRCVVAPRLDLTGTPEPQEREGADRYFLDKLGEPIAARVMGSQANRDRVLRGERAEDVANSSRQPEYKIRPLSG